MPSVYQDILHELEVLRKTVKYLACCAIPSIPSQADHAGEFLSTDGTNLEWEPINPISPSFTRQVITSGTSATGSTGNLIVTFNFAAPVASYTFKMPLSPVDQQTVDLEGAGTLTSGLEITSLSVIPNTGQTITTSSPLDSFYVGQHASFKWNNSLTTWVQQ